MDYKNPDILERLYHDEGMSMEMIAKDLGVAPSTIYNYMKKYKIKTRPQNGISPKNKESKKYTNREKLERMYIEDGKSLQKISEVFGVSDTTILYWLDKYGIERRSAHGHSVNYAGYITRPDGYMSWHSWTEEEGHKTVLEHRLLAVCEWGFEAVCDMEIHHINEIPWDNRIENIQLVTVSGHRSYHATKRERKKRQERG